MSNYHPRVIQIGVDGRNPHSATREDPDFTAEFSSLDCTAALRRTCQEAISVIEGLLEDRLHLQLHVVLKELMVLFKQAEMNKWGHLGNEVIEGVISLASSCSVVCLKLRLQPAEDQSIVDQATCSDRLSQESLFVSVELPNEELQIYCRTLNFVHKTAMMYVMSFPQPLSLY
ncbi:hypothetical protein N7540_011059 [Penicillium herquei]|nr:hypothetical protein N7540_011059 [Penicillium herquei]